MIINSELQNYAAPACKIISIQCKAGILDGSFRASAVDPSKEEDWGVL